ncbi:hypothetical protein LU631_02705 [Erwinia tracheiphila]|uniref:hypothetical protein n=1 Tax=Erwinia tracheiphila TaxID=65700 RepID=UPI001E3AE649|nr:hypothetical protein [Erwinia tracheiphila]UIA88358.1 hypothetical protein LU631_02705 [Erwinia tracheiphila]UIA96221.1 hypothetical protein LU633_23455 [Erwinia tracheiphila]
MKLNLHKIAKSAIGRVNPSVDAEVLVSDGFELGEGRKKVPKYLPPQTISIQLQPLSRGDLQHVDGMNLQGLCKSIHVDGNFYGTNREKVLGGDLFIIGTETWLVIEPLELWPDWCRLLVQLQVTT